MVEFDGARFCGRRAERNRRPRAPLDGHRSARRSRRSASRRRCWSPSIARARSSCRRPSLGAAGALRVFPRWSGEAALRVGAGEGNTFITLSHAHYVAYSQARRPVSPPARGRAVARRARRIPGGARGRRVAPRRPGRHARSAGTPRDDADTVAAITRALRDKHGYTLEPSPPPPGVDPVESFLLGERAGHCELFASAAVLLLRVRGVPARYVTGFRGGEWNSVGGYVAVRDDRAHAWAEAFVPDVGWVRVDATPPGPAPPRAGRLSRGHGRARLLLEPLGRRLRSRAAAGARAPRGPPPGRAAPRARRARARVDGGRRRARGGWWLVARRLRRRRGARRAHDARRRGAGGPTWTAPPPRSRSIACTAGRSGRLARAGWPRQPKRNAARIRARACARRA